MRDELVCELLHTLLDRYEQPERQRVVRVRLDAVRHPAYFQTADVSARQAANEALQQLAANGCLCLHWRKWEEGNWLDKVDLNVEQVDAVYALLRRAPLVQQQTQLRALLAVQTPQAAWHAAFLQWATAQLDAQASIKPLEWNDSWNRELLAALAALAQLRAPQLERKFSVRLFGDSKRFEDFRGAVLNVLRRFASESAAYGDDDNALLRAFNLERVPEFIPLAGSLILQCGEQSIDLTPFTPSVALSAATLREATVIDCSARVVVTIENLTSFSEFAAQRPPDVLAIYLGGFASPTAMGLLQTIRATHLTLPFFHWGDLDVGGLRILAHLRQHLGAVATLAMNAAIFARYQPQTQLLKASELKALRALREVAVLADCAPLIECLLAAQQKLEQEAVAVADCLRELPTS
jgi:hypothetical protein